jgi:hypothetical protein
MKASRKVKQDRKSIVAAGDGDDAALRAENEALKAENARVKDEVDARVKAGIDKVKAESEHRLSESEAANAALRAEVAALKRLAAIPPVALPAPTTPRPRSNTAISRLPKN